MSDTRKVQDPSTASSESSATGPGDLATVYVVQHERESEDGDDVKLIGVYRSEDDAHEAIARARVLPGFIDYPDGFSLDAYDLGQDHWTHGYVTVPAAQSEEPTGKAA